MNNSNQPWLTWISILALVAGLAIGLYALAAPVGVWLGLWEFGDGFQMLFPAPGEENSLAATSWGRPIATGALIIAVAIFAIARVVGNKSGPKLAGIALIGMAAAALAHYVPASYRPGPEDAIPPIHDISTDTSNPPQFVDVLPLRANAANSAVYGDSEGLTPARLAELQAEAYPDIVPQRFGESPDAVYQRAISAVRELGWDIVAEAPDQGRIEATDTTFWFRFKDDIVIRIRPAADGAVLDARSVSRVGRSDVGKNAARLRSFFEALNRG